MATSQRQVARKFVEYWTFQRGSEKGEDRQFWNSLLGEVLGVADVKSRIRYQVPVQLRDMTKYLDAWIPETHVLIEHKSRGVTLGSPQAGHGGKTPFEQALEYNNFPWSSFAKDAEGKTDLRDSATLCEKISQTAQAILDVRGKYPDSSLADLYDPLTMPPDLRAAHVANDRAVLAAYGLKPDTPEPEIVANLFKLYAEKVTATEKTRRRK